MWLRHARIAASCVTSGRLPASSLELYKTCGCRQLCRTRLTPAPPPVCDPLHSPSCVTQAGKNINRAAEDAKDSAGEAYDSTKRAVR